MNELAKLAIDAHGGLDRWKRFSTLSVHGINGGLLWGAKGKAGVLDDVTITVDLRNEKVSHWPFGSADRRSRFEPQLVALENAKDGKVLEELLQPRTSFQGHTLETPWSDLQLAYFVGCAMWTYLNTPFLLVKPGVESEEVAPWQEAGETWRPSESPPSLGYRDPQYRADTVLRSPRIAEEARLRRRHQWRSAGRTLRLRSQGVLWHRLSDEEKNLPSPTGRPFRTGNLCRLDRSRSVCPPLAA